ncbi:hypothetical protein D3C79_908710 [compost metagenome]
MYGRVYLLNGMVSNCARRLCPSVSAVIPVPSEIKKADRFICALGLKLVRILGYDRFGLPNIVFGILTYFPGPGHKRPAKPELAGGRPELFQHS